VARFDELEYTGKAARLLMVAAGLLAERTQKVDLEQGDPPFPMAWTIGTALELAMDTQADILYEDLEALTGVFGQSFKFFMDMKAKRESREKRLTQKQASQDASDVMQNLVRAAGE
jgi:hypothetical protein